MAKVKILLKKTKKAQNARKTKEVKKAKTLSRKQGVLSSIKPTIGVVGGCGVLATLDIEKEIIEAAQRLMFPLADQDYPNFITYQYAQFYDRNDAVCFGGNSPYKQYLECANALISIGAQVLLFACNTAHAYIDDLKNKIKVPIIDMIQAVVTDTIDKFPDVSKIGLLATDATIKEKLYHNAFASYKISIVTPDASIRKRVMGAIYMIKAGVENKESLKTKYNMSELSDDCFKEYCLNNYHPHKKILLQKESVAPYKIINDAIKHLSGKGCTHIILGCTELPLVIKKLQIEHDQITLINPNKIVAERAIDFYLAANQPKNN